MDNLGSCELRPFKRDRVLLSDRRASCAIRAGGMAQQLLDCTIRLRVSGNGIFDWR